MEVRLGDEHGGRAGGRRKVEQIALKALDAVVTSNAGCLQIGRYLDAGVPLFEAVQLVDASIRGIAPVHAADSSS